MAKIITITKEDTAETIRQKLSKAAEPSSSSGKSLDARKYTGRVKGFGDALSFQRTLRNEWD